MVAATCSGYKQSVRSGSFLAPRIGLGSAFDRTRAKKGPTKAFKASDYRSKSTEMTSWSCNVMFGSV
eukprot:5915508-Amphidinium_carterae.1